jgi:hypothetical protein
MSKESLPELATISFNKREARIVIQALIIFDSIMRTSPKIWQQFIMNHPNQDNYEVLRKSNNQILDYQIKDLINQDDIKGMVEKLAKLEEWSLPK